MRTFFTRTQKGFTLIELLVVISIIGVLSSVVLASLASARGKARDALVKLQVRSIVNALYLARDESTGQFPGVNGGWQCLKASGSCWNGLYTGNSTVTTALAPYLPTIPTPPNPPFGANAIAPFSVKPYMYDSYLYLPNYTLPIGTSGPGTYLIWATAAPIQTCPGTYQGQFPDGFYYCYQLVSTLN